MQVNLEGSSYDYYDGESVDLMGGRVRDRLRKIRNKIRDRIRKKRAALKGKSRAERRKIRRKFRRATIARVLTAGIPGARTIRAAILAKKLRDKRRRKRAGPTSRAVSFQPDQRQSPTRTDSSLERRKRKIRRAKRRSRVRGRQQRSIQYEQPIDTGRGVLTAPLPAAMPAAQPQVEVVKAASGKPDLQKMLIPALAIGAAAFFMMKKKK